MTFRVLDSDLRKKEFFKKSPQNYLIDKIVVGNNSQKIDQ